MIKEDLIHVEPGAANVAVIERQHSVDAIVVEQPPVVEGRTNSATLGMVERIVSSRKKGQRTEYLIKWKGWPSKYNTWEPLCHLANLQQEIAAFERGRAVEGREQHPGGGAKNAPLLALPLLSDSIAANQRLNRVCSFRKRPINRSPNCIADVSIRYSKFPS